MPTLLCDEEVAAIDERLVTFNDQGQAEGLKYERFAAVLVAALQDQQARHLIYVGYRTYRAGRLEHHGGMVGKAKSGAIWQLLTVSTRRTQETPPRIAFHSVWSLECLHKIRPLNSRCGGCETP